MLPRATIPAIAIGLTGSVLTDAARGVPAPAFTIIDVIPKNKSTEASQNSEPSIAVKPFTNNPSSIIIDAFDRTKNADGTITSNGCPIWATSDGGATWVQKATYLSSDTTLAWSPAGEAAYMATLKLKVDNSPDRSKIETWRVADPVANDFAVIDTADFQDTGVVGGAIADQPWIAAGRNAANNKDRLYVSYNDGTRRSNGGNKDTASVRYFDVAGATTTKQLDKNPGPESNGPPTRTVVSGAKVFSAFVKATVVPFSGDCTGDILVTRDEDRGANNFNESSTVIAGIKIPMGIDATPLGKQRCGSSLSMAVSPADTRNVYVAYTDVVGGKPKLHVRRSSDGGASWPDSLSKYDLPDDTAMPSLAVSASGVVGLLYEQHIATGTKLSTRFVQLDGQLAELFTPLELAVFDETSLFNDGQFIVGDYFDLEAMGQSFLGTFSAKNDPKFANFPQGAKFLRSLKDNVDGGVVDATHNFDLPDGIANSIDPFFFSTIAVPEPHSAAMLALGAMTLMPRGRRQ